MSKIPITYKWVITISMIIIGFITFFTALFVFKDHQYYRVIRWTGSILLFGGILLLPFAKESNKSEV